MKKTPLMLHPGSYLLKYLSVIAATVLFFAAFIFGSVSYRGFFDLQTFLNLFVDKSYLLISAMGMTLVILSGGIDLSVGSVVALTSVLISAMTEWTTLPPPVVILLALAVASAIGFGMGCMITFWKVPPFIATLAGMFFARGTCYIISLSSISINNESLRKLALWKLRFGPPPRAGALPAWFISFNVIVAIVVVAAIIYISLNTRFGRNIYAIGGSEQSALLMGIPVKRTKLAIYTVNGLCSGIAGMVFTLYMLSGYGLHAQGMEMDAIASVVIGGTMLSGGVGYAYGSIFGVLTLGIIQSLIMFNGRINSWWTKIMVGILLLAFIGLQSLVVAMGERRKKKN